MNEPQAIVTSSKALSASSANFEQLQSDVTAAYVLRADLRKRLARAKFSYFFTYIFTSSAGKKEKKEVIAKLSASLEKAYIELEFRSGLKDSGSWDESTHYFQELMQCARVWDLTSRQATDKLRQRTIANESIDRKVINYRAHRTLEFIKSDVENIYLPNINGADIYMYPTFVVLFKSYKNFSIHDLTQVDVSTSPTSFHEEQGVPKDSEVIGETYKYTNKNGQPDKRYSNNYSIPVVRYGDLSLYSDSGIHDRYMFSNYAKFAEFGYSFSEHLRKNLNKTGLY